MSKFVDLTNPERRMLSALRSTTEWMGLEGVLGACKWTDQAHASGSGTLLAEKGLIEIDRQESTRIRLGSQGIRAVEHGLVERRVLNWYAGASVDSRTMADLRTSGILESHEAGPAIGQVKRLGMSIEGGAIVFLDEKLAHAETEISTREQGLKMIADSGELGIDSAEIGEDLLGHFKSRQHFVEVSTTVAIQWKATRQGREYDEVALSETVILNELTPEVLQGGEWKKAKIKAYDVSLEAAIAPSGRPHPMQSLIDRIRSLFVAMGFSEIESDYVQSAGWNMDALFIPQDHPAREMQDTFYLKEPESIEIDPEDIEMWRSIHMDGGDTGSTGWGGSFSDDVSRRAMLRTHTTVATIQYLRKHPDKACRIFSIGRVFRKESIDRTHLPEFHQIEGIIMEDGASLTMLVTTLTEFFTRMGFPDVRVRPAYFPYTEPSLEVEVLWKGSWLELGGAGIFRPEVTEPIHCIAPVLAWGMGLERLAMLVLGLDDIRQLYTSDLAWLANQPIL